MSVVRWLLKYQFSAAELLLLWVGLKLAEHNHFIAWLIVGVVFVATNFAAARQNGVEGGATAAVSPALGQRHEPAHEDKPASGGGEIR